MEGGHHILVVTNLVNENYFNQKLVWIVGDSTGPEIIPNAELQELQLMLEVQIVRQCRNLSLSHVINVGTCILKLRVADTRHHLSKRRH